MALIKEYKTKGYTGEYWMIASYSPNKTNQITGVRLHLYKDADTREESINNEIHMVDLIIPEYITDVADVYTALKGADTPLDYQDEDGNRVHFFLDAKDDN